MFFQSNKLAVNFFDGISKQITNFANKSKYSDI